MGGSKLSLDPAPFHAETQPEPIYSAISDTMGSIGASSTTDMTSEQSPTADPNGGQIDTIRREASRHSDGFSAGFFQQDQWLQPDLATKMIRRGSMRARTMPAWQ